MDPDSFDLRPERTAASQPRDERQLHGAHEFLPCFRDHQEMSRITVDRAERTLVGGQVLRRLHAIAGSAKLVGGDQTDDAHDVAGFRPADNDRRSAQLENVESIHRLSLPGATLNPPPGPLARRGAASFPCPAEGTGPETFLSSVTR